MAWEKYVLNGPIKLTSRGCNLWLQCGGKLSTWALHSLARSTNSRFFVWLLWPSSISRTGSSIDGFVCLIKCSNHLLKPSEVIQPLGLHAKTVPEGAPCFNLSVIRTRGKITNGGMKCPVADIQIQAVLNTPRSAEVKQPTCLLPRNASTLDRLDWTYKWKLLVVNLLLTHNQI